SREPEGLRNRDGAARHQDQHQPDRFLPDRADADGPLHRRIVRAVRSHSERRGRRLVRAQSNGKEAAMQMNKRMVLVSVAALTIAGPALAQKKYDPGASDTEIKVGNIMPYSGPASAYGTIGRAEAAYFRM